MLLKGLIDEDFVNYRVPNMFISTAVCTFKCEKESGVHCCQNSDLAKQKTKRIDDNLIIERYLQNPITKTIVFGGLEPFEQYNEMFDFIYKLRTEYHCDDTVVIYTGYNKEEIAGQVDYLKMFKNIIIKFGRFVPNQASHYDEVLGVDLASPNQYAERIS